ncbi:orotidine 5'-phosphate decarboxylase [Patescibacteria group bacterium]|nr:orotidine 5'-phosphate decarboxylase [Patescibacteria group bacterium]MBU0963977.1 orotidine 5'-phosphate decarboxylase [Patescibacteria group bacterium]
MRLPAKKKYLQIAFNRTWSEVREMVNYLPASDRILVEAGTPFIKKYGQEGISALDQWWSVRLGRPGYVVADLKCMDRGSTEVEEAAAAGASAVTCLGLAPIDTINEFIKKCQNSQVDSMINMLNVDFPFEVLQKLKSMPDIVVLHRGADEGVINREKMLRLDQIRRIKGAYNIFISVAGGETSREVISSAFNDADIVVVWRTFYEQPKQTTQLAEDFLRNVK